MRSATKKKDVNEVLQRIEFLCQQRGWSHYQLSKESRVPYSSISNMFRRDTYPSLPVLSKLCDGFQMHMSDFFLYEGKGNFVLSPGESLLVDGFRSLGFHDQELVLTYVKGLCHRPS